MPSPWVFVRPHLRDLRRDLSLSARMSWRAARSGLRRRGPAGAGDAATRDIVLLPGIWESGHFLDDLAGALRAADFRVHTAPGMRLSVPRVEFLAGRVRRYLDAAGLRRVFLVAHSKGGLVGKQLMLDPRTSGRVAGLVALSTPWHGSSWADWMPPGLGLRDLGPSAVMVRRLAARSAVDGRIVSIYPRVDMHIPEGCHLAGARANVELPLSGHFLPLGSDGIADVVLAGLAELSAPDER